MSRDWSPQAIGRGHLHHAVPRSFHTLLSSTPEAQGGNRWPRQALRIAPQSLTASLRLRRERFLPPAHLPRSACALQASQTRPRVLRGASARAWRARARVPAARNRGRVALRRPVRSGPREASRALSARLAAAGSARPGCWSWRGGDPRWKRGGSGAAAVAGPGGGRAQVPATSPAVEARAPRGAARSRLRAQEVGEGLVGPAYPAAWRSLRSPWRPGGLAPAAPRPRRRLLLHEPSGVGEGGDPTTLLKSAGSPSSHAGGRRRRQTHKEGGERTPRGRAGAGGAAAWIGPARGEVGVSGLRLVERWSFSLRVGIGRTVRPGDEMAAGPGELGGVAARTSFVTARTALPSRRGGGYRAKSVTQSERPAHWLTVTESSLSASSCRGIGWSDSSPSPRDRLLRGGGLRKTGGEAGTETEAVRMRSGAQRPE